MGCDIHLFVEVQDDSGVWRSVDNWVGEDGRKFVPRRDSYYDARCYGLFAILANVRNGYGFAGVKTGSGFVPMAEPKGLPGDVSPEVKAAADDWASAAHSHSWHTLADIMAYDWTRETKLCGFIRAGEWLRWHSWEKKEGLSPSAWGEYTSCPKITPAEALALSESEAMSSTAVVFDEWERPYYKVAAEFLSTCVPRLWRLGPPDRVRIVFWFDN